MHSSQLENVPKRFAVYLHHDVLCTSLHTRQAALWKLSVLGYNVVHDWRPPTQVMLYDPKSNIKDIRVDIAIEYRVFDRLVQEGETEPLEKAMRMQRDILQSQDTAEHFIGATVPASTRSSKKARASKAGISARLIMRSDKPYGSGNSGDPIEISSDDDEDLRLVLLRSRSDKPKKTNRSGGPIKFKNEVVDSVMSASN